MDEVLLRHAELVADVRHAVFESAGDTDPGIRTAAAAGDELPEPWRAYAAKVHEHSYLVTDADIAAVKAAHRAEEEIFEVTVAAAMGAALHRLDAGLRAIRGAS